MSTENSDLKKKISSKAITALISENASQADKNSFPYRAYRLVFEFPNLLTPRWIASINNWGDQVISRIQNEAQDDEIYLKKRMIIFQQKIPQNIGPLKIVKETKIIKNHYTHHIYDFHKDYTATHVISNEKYWFRIIKDNETNFPSRFQYIILKNVWISNLEKDIYFIRSVRNFDVLPKAK